MRDGWACAALAAATPHLEVGGKGRQRGLAQRQLKRGVLLGAPTLRLVHAHAAVIALAAAGRGQRQAGSGGVVCWRRLHKAAQSRALLTWREALAYAAPPPCLDLQHPPVRLAGEAVALALGVHHGAVVVGQAGREAVLCSRGATDGD